MKIAFDASIDMAGRVCLVTGATSGHGEGVAVGLARMGAEVVLHGRSEERCRAAQERIERATGRRPDYVVCDLSRRDQIRQLADAWLASERPLHVLVNNAGLVSRFRQTTADGVELTWAVNYQAQYLLTLSMLDRLRASQARVVNVSSDMHRFYRLDFDDLATRRRYDFMRAYGRSKLAIVYFTIELARRLASDGVTVNALDPGPVASRIADRESGVVARVASRLIAATFPVPERAARTALALATSPALSEVSGGYFRFSQRRPPSVRDGEGARLWNVTAAELGLSTYIADRFS
jgi:NAD(P)-dependent dehydrogenase (short-subunit alcohol dehydrogenase family)